MASLEFSNNFAQTAGNDFYGGNLYKCRLLFYPESEPGWQVMNHSAVNYTIDLTSEPLRV